jgi:hypothetical protein
VSERGGRVSGLGCRVGWGTVIALWFPLRIALILRRLDRGAGLPWGFFGGGEPTVQAGSADARSWEVPWLRG